MANGTRSAVALHQALSESSTADIGQRVVELQRRLLELTGKANRSERNQLNRELWALSQQQQQRQHEQLGLHGQQSPAPNPGTPSVSSVQPSELQNLAEHWKILHGDADPHLISLCVRCGDGSAATCRFHPDAKAFAFGTGRFDYAYKSAWDTPHDYWFCCGGASPTCLGCCAEAVHTTNPDWWQEYAASAPDLECASDEEEEELDDDEEDCDDVVSEADRQEMEAGMAAMEIG